MKNTLYDNIKKKMFFARPVYEPRGEDRIAEVMLWLCHAMGLYCTIVGEYAMYRAGKLASRPNSLALYIARPQTWSSDLSYIHTKLWEKNLPPSAAKNKPSMDIIVIQGREKWDKYATSICTVEG